MTVSTTGYRKVFSGNGVTTAFATDFAFLAETELVVVLVSSAGVETTQVITTDYTVSGGAGSTGTVTMVVAPATGETLVVERSTTKTQTLDLLDNDPFPPDSIESAFDRAMMIVQETAGESDRVLKQPVGDTANIDRLPGLADRASKFLAFDASGDPLASSGGTGVPVSAFMETVLDDATAAAARTTLGLGDAATKTVGVTAGDIVQVDQAITATARLGTTTLGTTLSHTLSDTSTTITAFNGVAGVTYHCRALGAGSITHNATTLIITQTGASITTAAGDTFDVEMITATTCRVKNYIKADGLPVLPRGHLAGMQLSNDTDTDHDINVTAGECRNATNDGNITLASEITKQIDATWAAGDDAGGLSSSLTAPANATWYHVHAILVGGSADVGFDTSIVAANLIADHSATKYRRLGSVLTDGSANIIAFKQTGDWVQWVTSIQDVDDASGHTTSRSLRTLSTPTGFKNLVKFRAYCPSASDFNSIFSDPDETDAAPNNTMTPPGANLRNLTAVQLTSEFEIMTNTSSQIATRCDAATKPLDIITFGYFDRRGRDD